MKLTLVSLCLVLMCSSVWAQMDFHLIERFALLSNESYSSGNHKRALQQQGHTLLTQKIMPGVEVNYFLTIQEGVQFITVRGTANLQNALVDIDVALIENPSLGVVVHQGFAKAASLIYDDVKPFLKTAMPVSTTGHSLGGAVAVVLAMMLEQDGYMLDKVVTFGQPKVTNVTGANQYSGLPLIRVVTPKDIVPLVPPLSPLQIKNLDIYWHMGKEIVLLGENQYSQLEGLKSMLRATKFTSSLPNEDNLNAHKMQTYLNQIANKREHSKLVPYSTGFGLFGG